MSFQIFFLIFWQQFSAARSCFNVIFKKIKIKLIPPLPLNS